LRRCRRGEAQRHACRHDHTAEQRAKLDFHVPAIPCFGSYAAHADAAKLPCDCAPSFAVPEVGGPTGARYATSNKSAKPSGRLLRGRHFLIAKSTGSLLNLSTSVDKSDAAV
jgi:hypothetical protein